MPNNKKVLAVLASGGGSNFQAIIDDVESGKINAEIAVLIASNDSAYAIERAKKHGIKSHVCALKDFKSGKERDAQILSILKSENIDYVILAGYLGILSIELIDAYKNKIINIHPSLLPKFGGHLYHGLNVHKAVIESKESESGATVHFVDNGIDTGLIIAQDKLKVENNDTAESLQAKILDKIEHKLFVKVIKDLCDDKIFIENGKVIYKKD